MRHSKPIVLGSVLLFLLASCQAAAPTATNTAATRRTTGKPHATTKPTTDPNDTAGDDTDTSTDDTDDTTSSPTPSPTPTDDDGEQDDTASGTVESYFAMVKGTDGSAASGIVVSGYDASVSGVATVAGTATTDAKGQIEKIEAGGKTLNLVATSPSDNTLKGYLANVAPTDTKATIQLAQVGTITGTVKISGGTPSLENIKVYIPGTPFTANTDSTGAFTLDSLPAGTFSVKAESTDFGTASKSGVVVTAGQNTPLGADDLKLTVNPPTLTSLSLSNAGTGVELTLTGTNFGATGSKAFTVTFNGAEATTKTRVSDTTIKATVPSNATSGDVVVTVAGIESTPVAFTVLDHFHFTASRNSMPINSTFQFEVEGIERPKEGTPKIIGDPTIGKWEVSTGTAVSVNATGLVTAGATPGDATVKVSSGDAYETVDISVTDNQVSVTTLAGSGTANHANGTGTSATFEGPSGITADAAGNLFVTDQATLPKQYSAIRKVVSGTGVVSTPYGSGTLDKTDGAGTSAAFHFPRGMAFDGAGNMYVCDQWNNLIRKIDTAGNVSTYVSGVVSPAGVTVADDGSLYVTEWGKTGDSNPSGTCGRVVKIATDKTITIIAGDADPNDPDDPTNTPNFDTTDPDDTYADGNGYYNGVGTAARFTLPTGIVLDSAEENLYVAGFGNNVIRKIELATKTVSTVAGPNAPNQPGTTVVSGFTDGTGIAARFFSPSGLAWGPDGLLYISDNQNNAIRSLDVASGVVKTVAGLGPFDDPANPPATVDGDASSATFSHPVDLVFVGNLLYVADNSSNKIRKVEIGALN